MAAKIDQKIFLRRATGLTPFKPSNGAMPAPRPGLPWQILQGDFALVAGPRSWRELSFSTVTLRNRRLSPGYRAGIFRNRPSDARLSVADRCRVCVGLHRLSILQTLK